MRDRPCPSWLILFHAVVNGEVRRPFAIAPNVTRRRTRKPRAKAVRAEASGTVWRIAARAFCLAVRSIRGFGPNPGHH